MEHYGHFIDVAAEHLLASVDVGIVDRIVHGIGPRGLNVHLRGAGAVDAKRANQIRIGTAQPAPRGQDVELGPAVGAVSSSVCSAWPSTGLNCAVSRENAGRPSGC
jgi:hypothetical protein